MGLLVPWRHAISWAHFWMDSPLCSSTINRFFRGLRSGLEMARNQILAGSHLFFIFEWVSGVRVGKHIHVCVERLCQSLLGSSLCQSFNVLLSWDIPNPIPVARAHQTRIG